MYTYDEDAYSDIYKSAHNVRPGPGWYKLPPDEKQREWDSLIRYNEREVARERAEEQAAIQAALDSGAPDVATALRWLEQAEERAYE